MTKANYLDAAKKKAVREFLFSQFTFNKIVGLPGPNFDECISFYQSKGFEDIEVWENTPEVLMQQFMKAKKAVKLRFGNILEAEPDKANTLYDLDYCCTILHMKDHLLKFTNNFIMTFSLRAGRELTIKKFFEDRKEQIIKVVDKISPIAHTIFTTQAGKYIFTPYSDTSAMCCIAKIK
jgi:hypothetical protein